MTKLSKKNKIIVGVAAVVYNSLAVPSDDQIAKMLPTNAETITSVTTSGEPTGIF